MSRAPGLELRLDQRDKACAGREQLSDAGSTSFSEMKLTSMVDKVRRLGQA